MANHKWFGNKPFVTSSFFSAAMFMDRFVRGQGGVWKDFAARFMDRKLEQNIVGGRVFGTPRWFDRDDNPNNDHPFFNESRSVSRFAWNYPELGRGVRPRRLTAHTVSMILHLLELARARNFKIEYVVNSTEKHHETDFGPIGLNVIGHCVRVTNDFFRRVHRGEWDRDVIGNPASDENNAKLEALFQKVAGPLDELVAVEIINEAGAHDRGSWNRDDHDQASAYREYAMQLERAAREEQWPEGAVWMSEGGKNTIEYDPTHADCVAVHSQRPFELRVTIGEVKAANNKHGKLIYVNESDHYIDPAAWESTIGRGMFRPRSSTKDTDAYAEFVQEALDAGMWFCHHSLVGMSGGVWFDAQGNAVVMPLDGFEKTRTGTKPPKPPTPPPVPPPEPPEPPTPDAPVVLEAGERWHLRLSKPNRVVIERDPQYIAGINAETILQDRAIVNFQNGPARELVGVWRFHGYDRKDIGEFETSIYVNGVPVVLTSPHMQEGNDYDAWKWYDVPFPVKVGRGSIVAIDVIGRATGKNEKIKNEDRAPDGIDIGGDGGPFNPGRDTWVVRAHFGYWFLFR